MNPWETDIKIKDIKEYKILEREYFENLERYSQRKEFFIPLRSDDIFTIKLEKDDDYFYLVRGLKELCRYTKGNLYGALDIIDNDYKEMINHIWMIWNNMNDEEKEEIYADIMK